MSKWQVSRDGPQWLMSEEGQVVGYRDERGAEFLIPQIKVAEGGSASRTEPEGAVSGGGKALQKFGAFGVRPLTMSSLGNSIMVASMQWWKHACQRSKGLFVPLDNGHGVSGNTTAQMLARVAEVPAQADIVVLMECSNDAAGGVSAATHSANMRAIIDYYLSRAQLPVICFPPPRDDNASWNVLTHKYGLIDYFLALEYGIPCYFPWRQFVTADTTGGPTAAMGDSDGLHPGNTAHALAGADMLTQMLGTTNAVPLPWSTNTYGGVGLLSDALHLVSTGGWTLNAGGGNGAMSTVSDSDATGNWLRLTSSAAASYVVQKGGGFSGLQTGDELFICYLLRTTGAWSSGYSQINTMQVPSFGNNFGGTAYVASAVPAGVMIGAPTTGVTNPIVSGTTQILLTAETNCPAGYTLDIAQCQVWNKSACFR